MKNQADIYYAAILSRDPRFDGKFFVGVKTTGIYCRPICPARPKRQNIEFFSDAYAAERAGYRPCLRCRPDCAPQSPAWMGKSSTVQRALKLIHRPEYDEIGEEVFASHLGVSARHLRRLFISEIGQTAKQIQQNARLGFARKLIVETGLPVTDIAFSSGFQSVRRFNDAVKKRFHSSPSDLRKNKTGGGSGPVLELSLSYRPPFDWPSLLQVFRSHQIDGAENINDLVYERTFEFNGVRGGFRLQPGEKEGEMHLQVAVGDHRPLFQIVHNVRQMFDLDSDPLIVANAFADCKVLGKIQRRHPGLRIPGSWSPFEASVTAILGQLVSTGQARLLMRQLVQSYGEPIAHPFGGPEAFLFPSAERLAEADFASIGTTGKRKQCMRELCRQVADGKLKLDSTQDLQAVRAQLLSINGIGPWTAEYICLRALRDTDAFPASDLILKRALENHPQIDIEAMRPWRAYVAVHLWKEFAETPSKKKGK